jgi:hypothetical protein
MVSRTKSFNVTSLNRKVEKSFGMDDSQLRSAFTILKYLKDAPEADKQFIIHSLTPREIKSLCKLVCVGLNSDVKRKPKDRAIIKKHKKLVMKMMNAKNAKDFRKIGSSVSKTGGGFFLPLLLSLLGSIITKAIVK